MTTVVRPAEPGDAPLIHRFIRELAEYERLLDQVLITVDGVTAMLFGPGPRAFCEIAEVDGEAVGFALWFYSVSTFEGHHGLYLEDLFVGPRRAAPASAGRCSPNWPSDVSRRTSSAWSGRCSTGTRPPSVSTTRSARPRRPSGSRAS